MPRLWFWMQVAIHMWFSVDRCRGTALSAEIVTVVGYASMLVVGCILMYAGRRLHTDAVRHGVGR